MQDALRDGTKNKAPSGENNYNATASNDQVIEAIRLWKLNDQIEDPKERLSQSQIAKRIGVNQSQVSRWVNRKTRYTSSSN